MGAELREPPDSRLEKLIGFLEAVCRPDGQHWTNERVVVFTEYAHTVDWLAAGAGPARLRRAARGDPGIHPDRGPGVHPLAIHRESGQRAGAGAAGHRCRRRGHRPANPLPPAGQLRHPVQPVPAGTADRPHRPLRADRDTGGVSLRPRKHVVDLRRRRRLHGQDRPEGRPGGAGPRLGEPGDRRGDPGTLRPPQTRPSARPKGSTPTR